MAKHRQFLLCIDCPADSASLDQWKVYQALPDRDASKEGLLRVLDNEGEDYLYPATWFVPIELPLAAARAMQRAASSAPRSAGKAV